MKTKKSYLKSLVLLMFLTSLFSFGQQTIKGVVSSEDGSPVPGANIVQKGTTNGTMTDFDGNYTIVLRAGSDVLMFSSLGFATLEETVGNRTTVDVTLQEDSQKLEEVVVVGYGTAKRKNITGAVTQVDLEDSPLALAPNTNVLQTLRGSAAGINIGAQTRVGQTPNILVRGQNSINGTNNPLIVLDGVIFLGSIADINPADIASINILKDASAAAAYGSRSANGVIMINSKKGKTEKPVIRYSTSSGITVWQNKPNLMGTPRYLEKYAIQNNFESIDDIVWDDEYRTVLFDQRVNTDWLDLVSRTGTTQKHHLSVSGRSNKVNYFFSSGYEKQNGVIVGDQFRRISVRSRLNVNVTDWLEVGLDASYNNNDFSGVEANLGNAMIMAPIGYAYRYDGQPFNVDGNNSRALERYPTGSSIQSPLWGIDGSETRINRNDFLRMTANLLFKVPGVKGLTYKLNYSINGDFGRGGFTGVNDDVAVDDFFRSENYYTQEADAAPFFDRYSPAALQVGLAQANGRNTTFKEYNYVIDNIVNYNRDFGKHGLNLTLVATRDFLSSKRTTLTGSDFSGSGNTTLGINGLAFAALQINDLNIVERSNVGYLGQIGYAFDNKYHLNASYRRDGASVFGADRKYGNFSSIGAAWTVSEEGFLKGNNTLNYLKLNGSYGINGNQGVRPYQTLARVLSGPSGDVEYAFGDNPSELLFGIQQANLGNPDLGWERTTSFNAGLRSAWLNNRVFFDLDVYFSQTEDQIFTRQIPIMTGFESITASLGQVDNNGLEISLRTINVVKEDFTWNTDVNFWRNRNTVASLFGDDIDGDGREEDDIANNFFIGESLGALYGFDFIGVVQEEDTDYIQNVGALPGDPKFQDLNGDGFITAEDDRKILGFDKENFRLSLGNTITYKDFSFYTLFSGVFGGNGFYSSPNPLATSFRNRFDTNELNHPWWTPENRSNTYLRPDYIGGRYLGIQSRGFVRLQDVSLSYKMPRNILEIVGGGLSSLEFFVTGSNVYTFTNWSGNGDPEAGIQAGGDNYPVPATYTLGLNVSF